MKPKLNIDTQIDKLSVNLKLNAQQTLRTFHSICDDFNEHKLEEEKSKPILIAYQDMTIKAFDLIKFLYAKQPCVATRAYMIFCGKILLRLSHLIHNDRIETQSELIEYFKDFNAKYFYKGVSHD